MLILLDGVLVLDARREAHNLAERRLPPPAGFERANSLLNPLGENPARAWRLLSFTSLCLLDLDQLHILTWTDNYGTSQTFNGLRYVKGQQNLLGFDSHANATYLTEWEVHPYARGEGPGFYDGSSGNWEERYLFLVDFGTVVSSSKPSKSAPS